MTKMKEFRQDRPLNTVHFESPSHTGTLLCGLNILRSKGLLLDVTLIAEGEAFQAHRVVLASCSDYFRAMFTDAMKESRQREICLNGVSAEGMKYLLDYAYTSKLSLNLANIQDVLSAASHVQVFAVVEACSNYLQAQLDLENCVDIATIAETYSLHRLRKRVYRFMCGHLRQFACSPDFRRLSPAQLEHLLECDYPVDCAEWEVLQTVSQWLAFDKVERLGHAHKLLRNVHFHEIHPRKMQEFMDSKLLHSIMSQYPVFCRRLLSESYHANKFETVPSLVNSRGMELAVVKVGGFGIGGITNEITYYLPSAGKWRHLTTIPHVEQCNFGTAVLNNELYVVGGCFNQSLQENIHPFGFRYAAQYNKWATMAPMQRERCRFSLTVVDGQLYAVGGASEAADDNLDYVEENSPCECYDPVSDSWQPIAPLPGNRTQHAGTTWHHCMYISGGLDQDLVLSSMLCYNTVTDVWETKAPLLTPRADHCMVAYKDKLYVCGGWYEDEANGNRVLVDTIDAYDVISDSWEVVTHVPTPRYHAGIVIVEGRLYFIGGFHSDVMFDRATGKIECYDVGRREWTTEKHYPQDIWEHTCVTLYIPRCRDDMEVIAIHSRT